MRMLTENDGKREKCGLAAWHEKGLTGQGITVAVLDEPSAILDHMDREIYSAPLGEGSKIAHGSWVAQVVHEAAPGAKIVLLPFMNDADRMKTLMWLKANKPDIINMSLALVSADWCWSELMSVDSLVVAAAGNHGENTVDISKPACYDWTIGVGGIYEDGRLYGDNDNGESMDCVAYTGVYALNSKGKVLPFTGTSCAAPWLAGMLATYYTGKTVPPVGVVRELIKANCMDLEEAGKDRKSGYGFFVLPACTRIEPPYGGTGVPEWVPDAYQEVEVPEQEVTESEDDAMEIVLRIGSHAAWVNGECVALDCAPFASQGRTFVPLRAVAELMGCSVDYKDGVITIRA